MTATSHQLKQQEVINKIATQISNNALKFSTISPVSNFENDPRICLTSVHLPHERLLDKIERTLIEPLRQIEPNFYFYSENSLHLTIKNIRVINDPPHFTETDAEKVREIFSNVVPKHKQFNVYFYKLLLLPNNLALVGTTDPELDEIILDLDKHLNAVNLPDDKVYANSHYFFSNMTLCRFNTTPSEEFKQKVIELSNSLKFEPYLVDSITLLSCNAALRNKLIKGTWQLTSG